MKSSFETACMPEAIASRLDIGGDTSSRLLSHEASVEIIQRVAGMAKGGGTTYVSLWSWWTSGLRWARNRVYLSSDRRNIMCFVSRQNKDGIGYVATNQIDDVSLQAAMTAAERLVDRHVRVWPKDMYAGPLSLTQPSTTIWSDQTFDAPIESRSALARELTETAESKDMLSAGYLEVRGGGQASWGDEGIAAYEVDVRRANVSPTNFRESVNFGSLTQAQCSMTVRHPKGVGSGWAGLSSYDWAMIDGRGLANRALEKCLMSLNPVRIEPGRYTVILEPQAVCDLMDLMMGNGGDSWHAEDRWSTEAGPGNPFLLGRDDALKLWRTKLGLKVIDERITIDHDPTDPRLGVIPFLGMTPITWIDRGILTSLSYARRYAVKILNEAHSRQFRRSYRMSGGDTSVDEMIRTTKRGLLVTRFSGLHLVDRVSLLCTGVTRDGLWLIENGVISKSVNNMRITESPLFVLNQIEQLGVPVPVFRPVRDAGSIALSPVIVPPLKSNDFSFTSTIDAV